MKNKEMKEKNNSGVIVLFIGVLWMIYYIKFNSTEVVGIVGGALFLLGFLMLFVEGKKRKKMTAVANQADKKNDERIQYLDKQYEEYKSCSIPELSERLEWFNEDDNVGDLATIVLREGEHLYYSEFCAASHNEKSLVVERRTTNNGFSVKVADGLYYRTGESSSTPIRKTVKESYNASFYVTNQRVILVAEKYGFELPLKTISNIEYEGNYIAFHKGGKQHIVGFLLNPLECVKEVRNILYLILNGADESLIVDDIIGVDSPKPQTKALSSPAKAIREYKQLLDDGIISNEEFEVKKKELLSMPEYESTDEYTETEETYVSFDDVVSFIREKGECSVSMLQRQYRIGYNHAARLVDELEAQGYISPAEGAMKRKVLK